MESLPPIEATRYLFERIDKKLDDIAERIARVEGNLQRHDERSMSHHERIVLLEAQQRKATWALVSAVCALLVAGIPIILNAL